MKIEGGNIRDHPINSSRIDAWRGELTEWQIEEIRAEAGPMLDALGYTVDTALPRASLAQLAVSPAYSMTFISGLSFGKW
jgi:hypothetical protein